MSSWDEMLEGRVAVVTGGARGLGRADALALASVGADVVIADMQLESDEQVTATEEQSMVAQLARSRGWVYAESTAAEIRKLGRRALAVKLDVGDRSAVFSEMEKIAKE